MLFIIAVQVKSKNLNMRTKYLNALIKFEQKSFLFIHYFLKPKFN